MITSGDAQSLAALGSLSRDSEAAQPVWGTGENRSITNSALTRQFTEARRADIADDFAAARQLVTEVTVFFANRAAEQAALERRSTDAALTQAQRDTARDEAAAIGTRYGSGSAARLIGTAISGAAGGNVTGSLGSFVQAAAVGVLQGLAVREVKAIADTFLRNGVPTATSEAVRTALQGLVGCAGAAPTGNCASGALGAASSVVLNNLITSLLQPEERDPVTGAVIPRSLADQQSRTALIATLTGAIAGAVGANAGVASNAGVIETENNAIRRHVLPGGRVALTADANEGLSVADLVRIYGIKNHRGLLAVSQVFNTKDVVELQAIFNLLSQGKTDAEIRLAREAAAGAFGFGTAEARKALFDISIGTSNVAAIQAIADQGRQNGQFVLDRALLSVCAYDPQCSTRSGFVRVSPTEFGLTAIDLENGDGLRAAIFRRGGTVVVAFAGSNGVNDINDNVRQGLGLTSTQYRTATRIATQVSGIVGSGNLEFTGHSLGGGLAAIASASTGRYARTFNAAPVTDSSLAANGVTRDSLANIDGYFVRGDPVNALGRLPFTTNAGRQIPLGSVFRYGIEATPLSTFNHFSSTVIELLPQPSQRPARRPPTRPCRVITSAGGCE